MQITINDHLVRQTMQIFGIDNAQIALEKAIAYFINAQKSIKPKGLAVTQLEMPDTPSVYHGKPLSLEDMDKAVEMEAGFHR